MKGSKAFLRRKKAGKKNIKSELLTILCKG